MGSTPQPISPTSREGSRRTIARPSTAANPHRALRRPRQRSVPRFRFGQRRPVPLADAEGWDGEGRHSRTAALGRPDPSLRHVVVGRSHRPPFARARRCVGMVALCDIHGTAVARRSCCSRIRRVRSAVATDRPSDTDSSARSPGAGVGKEAQAVPLGGTRGVAHQGRKSPRRRSTQRRVTNQCLRVGGSPNATERCSRRNC